MRVVDWPNLLDNPNGGHMTWRLVCIIAALVLFILAGITALGWTENLNESALAFFGLAAFAAGHLP